MIIADMKQLQFISTVNSFFLNVASQKNPKAKTAKISINSILRDDASNMRLTNTLFVYCIFRHPYFQI